MPKINFFDIIRSNGGWSLKFLKAVDYFVGFLLASILPRQKVQATLPKSIHRILIIRPGGVGDAVFLLPILKELKTRGMDIDVLCEMRNAEIFSSQGYQVFFYNQFKSLNQILKNTYDIVIDTEQWHYVSAIIGYFTRSGYRVGFATRPLRTKLFNKPVSYGDNDYELDNFKRLFDGLVPVRGPINDINDCFHVPDSIKIWASQQIPNKSVTIFLGASIAIRRFSHEQLLLMAHNFLEKSYYLVLLGGKDVESMAQRLIRAINDPRILNFVGKISLMQSAGLIQTSQKFIGPDSGLMHLACAVGTSVVAIFGPGNLIKWGPQGNKHKIVTENVLCSPCTRFGYTIPICGGRYQCVRELNVLSIIEAIENSQGLRQ